MRDRPLLVCDLDDTLVHGNSFRLLVAELLHPRTWSTLGPAVPLRLAGLAALRMGRRLDRVAFKRSVHAMLRSLPPDRQERLTRQIAVILERRLREEVRSAVRAAGSAGFVTVLATAAFEEHARPLARTCGFDHLTATAWTPRSADWVELSGTAKRDGVARAAIDLRAGRPWILISDHEDDEPLADLCDHAFWVNRRSPLRAGAVKEVAFTESAFAERIRRGRESA